MACSAFPKIQNTWLRRRASWVCLPRRARRSRLTQPTSKLIRGISTRATDTGTIVATGSSEEWKCTRTPTTSPSPLPLPTQVLQNSSRRRHCITAAAATPSLAGWLFWLVSRGGWVCWVIRRMGGGAGTAMVPNAARPRPSPATTPATVVRTASASRVRLAKAGGGTPIRRHRRGDDGVGGRVTRPRVARAETVATSPKPTAGQRSNETINTLFGQ